MKNHTMKTRLMQHFLPLTVACLICTSVSAASQQQHFASPDEATKAFITTLKQNDANKLIKIFSDEAKPLLNSGDAIQDKENRNQFLNAYEQENKLEKESDQKYILSIGQDHWHFPIPLVKDANGWYFDTQAGKQEILQRRIGRNELSAIQAMLAYVDAQREYYLANPQKDKLNNYAQKLLSSPGKRDGLYYPVKEGETPSPLGELYAKAQTVGYTPNKKGSTTPQAYYGYYYRILKSQGKEAKGGEYNYTVKGKMIGGHALIAWPAKYGNSGVMTFMVNHDGIVYEKDLGSDTPNLVKKITQFNPDKTWKPAPSSPE